MSLESTALKIAYGNTVLGFMVQINHTFVCLFLATTDLMTLEGTNDFWHRLDTKGLTKTKNGNGYTKVLHY